MKNPFRSAGILLAVVSVAAIFVGLDLLTVDQGVWYAIGTAALYLVPRGAMPAGWAAADTNAPIAEVQKAVKEILEGFTKHQKTVQDTLAEHEKQIKDTGKASDTIKDEFAKLNKSAQDQHGRLTDLETKLAREVDSMIKARTGGQGAGDLLVEDKGFQEFAKAHREDGAAGNKFRFRTKNITSLAGSGGPGIYADQLPGVIENPLRPLSIRDLVMPGRTVSNLLEWIQELSFTNSADVVSEGTLKPQSELTYQRQNTGVSTIAHWIRATKQVLSDFPQLASLINGRLRWGLKIKEEDQLLFGDGVGENLLGLVPQATTYNAAAFANPSDTMIDVLRHAMLQVRLSFYPSTGHVLSPIDWHYIELTKDNENRYIMASPTGRAPAMLWGLPVVESDAMHAGNFLTGSYRMAAQIFDREDASIQVSTEDQDNFVKNLVTILCEERLALLVYRPLAFVYGAFPAGATT